MSSSIYIKASDNIGTFLASTSTVVPAYGASPNNSNHSIELTFANTVNPTISLAQDPTTGEYIENSLSLLINWGSGRSQTAFLVHNDAYGCEWTIDGVQLTPSAPSKKISNGGTIYAKSLRNSAAVPTKSVTKVRIRGYWTTNTTPDPDTGCYNNPSIIQRNVKYLVDWQAPDLSSYSAADKPKILSYLIVYWKGNWGAADGVTGIGATATTGGDTTSLISDGKWWSGAEGHHLKHTVFTIYDRGIYPPISTVIGECVSERPTGHAGSGDGSSVKNYSNYSLINSNDTTVLYEVSFFLENGTSYIKINDKDYTSMQPRGSKVVPPTGSSWIPSGKHVTGWYQKDGTGSWGTTLKTTDQISNISVSQDVAFKVKFDPDLRKLIFDANGGHIDKVFTDDPTYGTDTINSDKTIVERDVPYNQSYGQMCSGSKLGFVLDGWWTQPTGGSKVTSATIMPSGSTPIIIYAHWKENWNVEMTDLVFLHYEKPSVNIGVKRDSLENPEGVRLWVKPTIHPLIDRSGEDKNFVADITDIYWVEEDRNKKEFRTISDRISSPDTVANHSVFDSRTYYNWQTANSDNDIIRNLDNNEVPSFVTGVLMDKVRTDSSAKQRDFDINEEYQYRALVRDALQSYYDKEAYGDDYQYKNENYSPWGQYLSMPDNWFTSSNSTFQKKLKSKSSGVSDASNNGDSSLLLKYVTKLLVHNPLVDDVLKETRGEKKIRQQQNPPETDFWQIREHTQNSGNSLEEIIGSLLDTRGKAPDEDNMLGGSVNGFTEAQIKNYIIPTLLRELRENERLVYDPSQVTPLIKMLYQINSDHDKISQEYTELTEQENYSGIDVGDITSATKLDNSTNNGRILELDGERHQRNTNWETEPDSLENRVLDTDYKDVELRNFEGNNAESTYVDKNNGNEVNVQSTIDHIYDYDISQLDLKTSLSDLLYILSRMTPRAEGSEGALFDESSMTQEQLMGYWDSANNRFKDSAFTNWIPSEGKWRTPENNLSEYDNPIEDYSVLVNTNSLDKNNTYGDNDFLNNGCKATCMGLCTTGCYQTCVGGCKTACGNSCFFGCKTSCKSSCGGDCTTSCLTYCTGTCNGQCRDDCGGTCSGTCSGSCTGTCGLNCSGSCEAACKKDCDSDCKNKCKSTCSGNCGSACSGTCQNGCKTSCTGTCKGGCGTSCNKACSGGCGGGCSGNCSTSCSGSCAEGCSSGCKNTCSTQCIDSCSGTCSKTCNAVCLEQCEDGCSGQCYYSCNRGCRATCTNACTGGCASACSSACSSGCSSGCTSTCANSCTGGCGHDCDNGCSTGCKTNCLGKCKNTCTWGCNSGCKYNCVVGCIGTCTVSCFGNCKLECTANCTDQCSSNCLLTCGSGCMTTCNNGCSTSCEGGCIGCSAGCKINCDTSCNIKCGGNCTKTCNSTCITTCGNGCGNTCHTTCGNGCSGSCGSDCTGTCTKRCDSSCAGGCKSSCEGSCSSLCGGSCTGKCSGGCTGTCGYNCYSACTAACSDSCKDNCKNKCYSGCSAGCTQGCKNSCEATCSTGCVTGCKSNCSTSCSASCSGGCGNGCQGTCLDTCSGTCSGTCDKSCVGTCKGACGSGCDNSCNTSCEETCYESCHTSCTGSAYKLSA